MYVVRQFRGQFYSVDRQLRTKPHNTCAVCQTHSETNKTYGIYLFAKYKLLQLNHTFTIQMLWRTVGGVWHVNKFFWLGATKKFLNEKFFDVRVFNPFARSYSSLPLSRCYRVHEQEKRRAYDERIREVKRACFSPLVFSATGGMGPVATTVYRKCWLGNGR